MKRLRLGAVLLLSTSAGALHAQQAVQDQAAPAQGATTPSAAIAGAQRPDEETAPVAPQSGAGGATADPYADPNEPEEIVITGQRPRGAVIGDIDPEVTFSAADIAGYGASTIAELLTEIEAQTTSAGGGAPVTLLNGKRISSRREIDNIPPEAIQRMEVLPEEVALKYGYSANQKVVNFVLRPRFRAITTELEGGLATDGGGENGEAQLSMFRVIQDTRINLSATYQERAQLRESQRDIISSPPGQPFAITGNVTAPPGVADREIDPALSALARQIVTVARAPFALGRTPTLADFAADPNDPLVSDITRFRTLQSATRQLELNAVLAQALGDAVTGSMNASLDVSDSRSLQGLASASLLLPEASPFSPFARDVQLYRYLDEVDPLRQRSKGLTGHLGVSLNGELGPRWRWTLTSNFDRAESNTRTDRTIDTGALQTRLFALDPTLDPFADLPASELALLTADRARSIRTSGDVVGVLNGPLFTLPAGTVTTTLRVSGEANGNDSRSTRRGIDLITNQARETGGGQANVNIPIAGRGILPFLGSLSANATLGAEEVSGFGTLRTLGYGANWQPIEAIGLTVSMTENENAPSISQLGDPLVTTPGVRVFDFTRGETVDITRITGGVPTLPASKASRFNVGLRLRPAETIFLIGNYSSQRIKNSASGFPNATAQIEAAFPDRFIRSADGRLLQIDSRPVPFAEDRRDQIRVGFNVSHAFTTAATREFDAAQEARRAARQAGETPPGRPGGDGQPDTEQRQRPDGERPRGDRPGGGFGGGGFGGGGGGFGGGGGGRGGGRGGGGGGFGRPGVTNVQFNAFYTYVLQDEVLIRDGVPLLDNLRGSPSRGSGTARSQLQARAAVRRDGIGFELDGQWRQGTRVNSGPVGTGSVDDALFFSSLTTVNAELTVNFAQIPGLARRQPFARGARLQLELNNIFNQRQSVRDENGITPLANQRAYQDPLGRTIQLSFRKLF